MATFAAFFFQLSNVLSIETINAIQIANNQLKQHPTLQNIHQIEQLRSKRYLVNVLERRVLLQLIVCNPYCVDGLKAISTTWRRNFCLSGSSFSR